MTFSVRRRALPILWLIAMSLVLPACPPEHTISLSRTGTGSGRVVSSLAGIDCGSDCEEKVPSGTTMVLTATPDANSVFVGWSGACSGTSMCTVQSEVDVQVGAQFDLVSSRPVQLVLQVVRDGNGSGRIVSSPDGIDCGPNCQENVDSGTTVVLTATAAEESTFAGWSGGCSGIGPCTVEVSQDLQIHARFARNPQPGDPKLKVSQTGTGSGQVVSSPAGIDCGSACETTFAPGTTLVLTATPGDASLFVSWSGACTGTAACSVKMDQDLQVTAQFDHGDCISHTQSTLPGLHLIIPPQKCRFTLAELHSNALLNYSVEADTALSQVTIRSENAGNCHNWGVYGMLNPVVEGGGQFFGYQDIGFCGNDRYFTRDIPVGLSTDALLWNGKNWTGPSDFGNPEGPAFPPGDYTFHVYASGTYQGGAFTVDGTMPLHIDP